MSNLKRVAGGDQVDLEVMHLLPQNESWLKCIWQSLLAPQVKGIRSE